MPSKPRSTSKASSQPSAPPQPPRKSRALIHLIVSCPYCWRPVWQKQRARCRTGTPPLGENMLGYTRYTREPGLGRKSRRGSLLRTLAEARATYPANLDHLPELGRRAMERMLATGLLSVADARAVLAQFDRPHPPQQVTIRQPGIDRAEAVKRRASRQLAKYHRRAVVHLELDDVVAERARRGRYDLHRVLVRVNDE